MFLRQFCTPYRSNAGIITNKIIVIKRALALSLIARLILRCLQQLLKSCLVSCVFHCKKLGMHLIFPIFSITPSVAITPPLNTIETIYTHPYVY